MYHGELENLGKVRVAVVKIHRERIGGNSLRHAEKAADNILVERLRYSYSINTVNDNDYLTNPSSTATTRSYQHSAMSLPSLTDCLNSAWPDNSYPLLPPKILTGNGGRWSSPKYVIKYDRPTLIDDGGCRCALQEELDTEAWRCIANMTDNIYSGQMGKWFFAVNKTDRNSLKDSPNSDRNPPNLTLPYIIKGNGQDAEFAYLI